MRGKASGDVLKLGFYAAVSVWLGAWISPLFYNAGKALAEVSSTKMTNGPLLWLAGRCNAADFPDFFEKSLLLVAAILFWPFIKSLRGGYHADEGQRLQSNPRGLWHAAAGFLGFAVTFCLIAGGLVAVGIFEWKNPGILGVRLVLKVLAGALALAIFQEILFRGIALGIFLRAMRPAAALVLAAAFFAGVHFLDPPPGLTVPDPEAAGVGFQLLRKIAAQFSELRLVVGTFTPLLALGGVLAYARWRTASLSLPIGLHAGWLFVHDIIGSMSIVPGRSDFPLWVLSGTSLKQGLISVAGILFVGVLVHLFTRPHDAKT